MQRTTPTVYEWQTAHLHLDNAPNGTKLPYSLFTSENGSLMNRWGKGRNFNNYTVTQSFIKIGGVIYAIARGKTASAIIGSGAFGKVKFTTTEDGTIRTIKISKKISRKSRESDILTDISLSNGHTPLLRDLSIQPSRALKTKFYTDMPYLGESLSEFLKHNITLDDTKRLDLAIQLCWKVFQLHNGHLSSNRIPYAHLDIKSRNITVRNNNQIHLVDFGYAIINPRGMKFNLSGTPFYLAPANDDGLIHLSRQQCDIIALKRTLFMPHCLHHVDGFTQLNPYKPEKNLLRRDFILKNSLYLLLGTGSDQIEEPYSFSDDKTTAVAICSIFIAIKLNLPIPKTEIHRNKKNALIIAGLYFAGETTASIKAMLADQHKGSIAAALIELNKLRKLDDYLNNQSFLKDIKHIKSHTIICAIIELYERNLSQHAVKAKRSKDICIAIRALCNTGLSNYVSFVANNTKLAYLICDLEKAGLEQFYEKAITSSSTQSILFNIIASKNKSLFAALKNNEDFSDNELNILCTNKTVSSAIKKLFKYKLSEYVRTIVNSEEMAEMITSGHHIKLFSTSRETKMLNTYLTDADFRENINKARTLEHAYVILHLKKNNLEKHYHKAQHSDYLDTILLKLYELHLEKHFHLVLENDNLASMLRFIIEEHGDQDNMPAFTRSFRGLLLSPHCLEAVNHYLNHVKSYKSEHLHALAADSSLALAINYLVQNDQHHQIEPILNKILSTPLYQPILSGALIFPHVKAALNLIEWSLDEAVEDFRVDLLSKCLLVNMLYGATNKEHAEHLHALYKSFGELRAHIANMTQSCLFDFSNKPNKIFSLLSGFFSIPSLIDPLTVQKLQSDLTMAIGELKIDLNTHNITYQSTILDSFSQLIDGLRKFYSYLSTSTSNHHAALFQPASRSSSLDLAVKAKQDAAYSHESSH